MPDIPKPLRSELVRFVPDLGGVNAALVVYDGWGDCASVVEALQSAFRDEFWRRNHRFEELAQSELPGVLLSYTRGHERCLMSVERVRETGRLEILVLYVERDRLPSGFGF